MTSTPPWLTPSNSSARRAQGRASCHVSHSHDIYAPLVYLDKKTVWLQPHQRADVRASKNLDAADALIMALMCDQYVNQVSVSVTFINSTSRPRRGGATDRSDNKHDRVYLTAMTAPCPRAYFYFAYKQQSILVM